MLKNIKINAEIHQKIAIKAAEMAVKKGELVEKLIECGLEQLKKKENCLKFKEGI
jgi:hypothetical protein